MNCRRYNYRRGPRGAFANIRTFDGVRLRYAGGAVGTEFSEAVAMGVRKRFDVIAASRASTAGVAAFAAA